METEFKYSLKDEKIFDEIVEDAEKKALCQGKVDVIGMQANYFDTESYSLREKGVAYRIRRENDRITATIKWDKEEAKDALHVREEFNLVINDEKYAEKPNIEIFKSSDAYEVLYNAVKDQELVKKIGMDYLRRQIKLDTGKSISCISIDKGVIHHEKGYDVPVLELEIEWYYGDEDDFKQLASEIQNKYDLKAENISKLQRAFI